MYYVIVPEPVKLKTLKGEPMMKEVTVANGARIPTDEERPPMSLFDIICDVAFNDGVSFGEGWKPALALKSIHEKFSVAKAGEIVELEDDHLERLKGSLLMEKEDSRRTIRIDPHILWQITTLLGAIKNAMDGDTYKKYVKDAAKKK